MTTLTNRGLVRGDNEDRVGVLGWLSPADMTEPVVLQQRSDAPLVVAVADGLGGHQAGEVASEMAIRACMTDASELLDRSAVAKRCRHIHASVLDAAAADPALAGMASTLTVAVVTADQVIVANVGDSRAYYVEPGFVDLLTTDDADGSGALTQVVGGHADEAIEPRITPVDIGDGCRLLLCTDGLHAYVAPDEFRQILGDQDAGHRVVARLQAAVVANGAPDNVSLCVVDVVPVDRPGGHHE